jgi:hypothetical protein
VTQLYDDVDDVGDGRYGGRLRPVPEPAPEDEPWSADGHRDAQELWHTDGVEAPAPADGEPLF